MKNILLTNFLVHTIIQFFINLFRCLILLDAHILKFIYYYYNIVYLLYLTAL